MIRALRQPDGSPLCGQTCVAMAAGVSLDRAIEAVGHSRATYTRDVIRGLRALGVPCADRLRRVSRRRPALPQRAIVSIWLPPIKGQRRTRGHWMLTWDGVMYDPSGSWPNYKDWTITSYLEIF